MDNKGKNLFEELYNKTDESIKLLKKPLVKRQLKRKYSSAYDDAENKKVDAESKLQDLRTKFTNFEINDILAQKKIIVQATQLQELIAEDYQELFGEALPRNE